MNYTNDQVASWTEQLDASCKSLNLLNTEAQELLVKKFLKQITNGVSVQLHKNCMLSREECDTKRQRNEECTFFHSSQFDEMVNNRKKAKTTKKALNEERNQTLQSDAESTSVLKELDNDFKSISNGTILNEKSSFSDISTSGINSSRNEVESANCSSIKCDDPPISSTPKAELNILPIKSNYNNELSVNSIQLIQSDPLLKAKHSRTYIAEEVPIKNKSRKRKSRAKAKPQNVEESKISLQCEKSFLNKFQEGLTFQDLLMLVTDTNLKSTLEEENEIGENDFLKIETNDTEEGDKIIIKLPRFMNRKTTIDLTTSERIFEMMLLPVLVDEKQRFQTWNTNECFIQNVPQNVQKINETFQVTQYSDLPTSQETEKIIEVKSKTTKKKTSKNCTGKSGPTSLKNSTQPMPVRVTSSNGYDKTHFVDIPMQELKNSTSTDFISTLNLTEDQYAEFPTSKSDISNEISAGSKKRGRPAKIQAIKSIEDLSKMTVKLPKKRRSNARSKKSRVIKKTSNEGNVQYEKSCVQGQEETIVINNSSFLAGLDMPLLNDDTSIKLLNGSQANVTQIHHYNSGDNRSKIYTTVSSSAGNYNIQPPYSTNNMFTPSCTVSEFSTLDNVSIQKAPNELLERFYIGEVGKVVGNEIEILISDSGDEMQTVEEQLLTHPYISGEEANKTLQDAINYSSTTEPLITIMELDGDEYSFLENIVSYDTNQKNVFASYVNSSNYTNSSNSVVDSYNQANVGCAPETISQSVLNSFTLKNNSFTEKVSNAAYTAANHTTKKAFCFGNNCYSGEYNNSVQENLLNKTTTQQSLIPLQAQEKDIGNMLSNHHTQKKASFTNFNNVIVDHSYSMRLKQKPQCNDLKAENCRNQLYLEKQQSAERLNANKNPFQVELNDTNVWAQSEHMQSPFSGFSEQVETVHDEELESLKTPSPRKADDNHSSLYCSEKYIPNLIKDQTTSVKFESEKLNNRKNSTTSVQVEKKANQSKSSLQESDLFLPPLELESKLDNDVLDFECGSEMSFENSNDSFSKKENESSSDTSVRYQSSIENNETMNKDSLQVISNEIISSAVDDKTGDLVDLVHNNLLENNFKKTSPIDNKQSNIKKDLLPNQIVSRRKSETSFGNKKPRRLPSRLSIDTMPTFLSQFKIPKRNEAKPKTMSINTLKSNTNLRQHLQPKISNLNMNKNIEMLKNNNSKIKALNNAHDGSAFSNMGSLNNILKVLIQNSSWKEVVPQLTEMILSSVESDNKPNERASQFDNRSNQFQSTNKERQDYEKPSSLQTFADIAEFFNITCIPSLSDICSNKIFCPFSHILRDAGWVRIELRRLSVYDVNILYKFIYKYKNLYSHYFDVFCYYYTENRKTESLCRMLIDCQRYLTLSENKFIIIYNCLIDCGLNKQTACGYVLKNLRRRTSKCLNTIMYIIVESDWTLFVNHVREIISDPNIVLTINTLEKMAQSFIKNPNDRILVLFWHCIFKIDSTEMHQIQGHPALQMIIQNYNFFPSGVQDFCANSNGTFGNHHDHNSGLFKF